MSHAELTEALSKPGWRRVATYVRFGFEVCVKPGRLAQIRLRVQPWYAPELARRVLRDASNDLPGGRL